MALVFVTPLWLEIRPGPCLAPHRTRSRCSIIPACVSPQLSLTGWMEHCAGSREPWALSPSLGDLGGLFRCLGLSSLPYSGGLGLEDL